MPARALRHRTNIFCNGVFHKLKKQNAREGIKTISLFYFNWFNFSLLKKQNAREGIKTDEFKSKLRKRYRLKKQNAREGIKTLCVVFRLTIP